MDGLRFVVQQEIGNVSSINPRSKDHGVLYSTNIYASYKMLVLVASLVTEVPCANAVWRIIALVGSDAVHPPKAAWQSCFRSSLA